MALVYDNLKISFFIVIFFKKLLLIDNFPLSFSKMR